MVDLDYADFDDGSMSVRRVSTSLPFRLYKLTEKFQRDQLAKPQADSRNPNGTEHRYWELEDKDGNLTGNHVHEARGRRLYRGECIGCADVVIAVRDVSGAEFRGRGNRGMRGRWPKFCNRCRKRRQEESLQRRSAAKRKADRERMADKRTRERDDRDQPKYVAGHWFRDERGEEQWSEGYWVHPG